jgi:hypothetical protein
MSSALPTGKSLAARHLNTLAALISGRVGSQSSQLPHIATKVPDGTKPEGRIKRFTRWLKNEGIERDGWQGIIHRRKRCDLSLFQLGLRFLEHFLNEVLPIPVQFHLYAWVLKTHVIPSLFSATQHQRT